MMIIEKGLHDDQQLRRSGIYHPFGILFRNLNIFYNHINPSDLKNPVIGFQLRNSYLYLQNT